MTEHAHQAVPATMRAWQPYAALLIGVLAVSTAAIFIRLAQEEGAPSLVLAAARLAVASLVLTPIVLRRHRAELHTIRVRDMWLAVAAGVALGLHFASWITSLEYTAVVNSVTLVTTNPLWVALMTPLVLKERVGRWTMAGLVLALGGGIIVALSGEAGTPPTRQEPLLGNGLALFGAWMVSIYFVIGRQLRSRLSVMTYIWLVYSVAAVLLSMVVVVSGQQVLGLPGEAYLWMVLMGLVPQLIGHSAFNYALGFLPAAYVTMVTLFEPVGSGLLAMLLLDEWPVPLQLAGATLILVGIALATRESRVGKTDITD